MLIHSDISKFFQKVTFLLLFFSYSLAQAQQTIVHYETISPPIFSSENMPYVVGLLDFNTSGPDSNFTEEFYNAFKADTILLSKFLPYSFNSLKQVKDKLRIESYSHANPDLQKKLLENLKIKYLISGERLNQGFSLIITSTESGKVIFSNSYFDSDSSTAIKDALRLFSLGETTRYKRRGTLTISVTPTDSKFTIDLKEQSDREKLYLDPGNYMLEFSREGYYPLKERIEIKGGLSIEKEYHLVPSFGEIQFDVSPIDLNIKMMNEQDTTITKKWTGDIDIKNIQSGKYIFEFTRVGFFPERRLFRINPDERIQEKINLVRKFNTVEDISSDNVRAYGLKIEPGEYSYRIHYNLAGKIGEAFDVTLSIRLKDDPGDTIKDLVDLEGDCGKRIKVGVNKTIIWNIQKEFPRGLGAEKYLLCLEID